MKIGTVAYRRGIPARTIRYYEDIGLVRRPKDGRTGVARIRRSMRGTAAPPIFPAAFRAPTGEVGV